MIIKKITAKDFNGVERTEEFCFHMMESELIDMDLMEKGGMKAYIDKIIHEQDQPKLVEYFKDIIDKSYGIKSPDGREFVKDANELKRFKSTNFYSTLYMELVGDDVAAAEFINGIMPDSMPTISADEARKYVETGELPKSITEKANSSMNVAPVPIRPVN